MTEIQIRYKIKYYTDKMTSLDGDIKTFNDRIRKHVDQKKKYEEMRESFQYECRRNKHYGQRGSMCSICEANITSE